MKICRLKLKNFKRFENLELDFTDKDSGEPKSLILLQGNNGSGKTTVLQAIAAMLGQATGRLTQVSDLNWPGFDLNLSWLNWPSPAQVDLEVALDPVEIEATANYHHLLAQNGHSLPSLPENISRFTIRLQAGKAVSEPASLLSLLQGRAYATQALGVNRNLENAFDKVGFPFWYTSHRSPTSLQASPETGVPFLHEAFLRKTLTQWLTFHQQVQSQGGPLSNGVHDPFSQLQNAYRTIFPRRRFKGLILANLPGQAINEPWFYLHDGIRQYEISEMSGGERAVMPMLFDFVNWQINQSVVLIDELELHLHPPLQQALLRALKHLGKNNQFFVTTHSDYVYNMFDKDDVVYLDRVAGP